MCSMLSFSSRTQSAHPLLPYDMQPRITWVGRVSVRSSADGREKGEETGTDLGDLQSALAETDVANLSRVKEG